MGRKLPVPSAGVDPEMVKAINDRDHAIDETPSLTDDSVFADIKGAHDEYEEVEKRLIEFVEKQVSHMKANVLFAGREPSFYELNTALSNFETVAVGLTSLYSTVRIDRDLAQEAYDDAYAAWFVEERSNLESLAGTKLPSTKEIDMLVRVHHMKELAHLKAEVIATETKRSMIERLIKNWESYQWCLSTLSRNAVAESVASGVSKNHEPDLGE
jgi:hypothetical protein